jgi:hypothetical protein
MADKLINKWKKIVLSKSTQQADKQVREKDSEKNTTSPNKLKKDGKENNKASTPSQGIRIIFEEIFKINLQLSKNIRKR